MIETVQELIDNLQECPDKTLKPHIYLDGDIYGIELVDSSMDDRVDLNIEEQYVNDTQPEFVLKSSFSKEESKKLGHLNPIQKLILLININIYARDRVIDVTQTRLMASENESINISIERMALAQFEVLKELKFISTKSGKSMHVVDAKFQPIKLKLEIGSGQSISVYKRHHPIESVDAFLKDTAYAEKLNHNLSEYRVIAEDDYCKVSLGLLAAHYTGIYLVIQDCVAALNSGYTKDYYVLEMTSESTGNIKLQGSSEMSFVEAKTLDNVVSEYYKYASFVVDSSGKMCYEFELKGMPED